MADVQDSATEAKNVLQQVPARRAPNRRSTLEARGLAGFRGFRVVVWLDLSPGAGEAFGFGSRLRLLAELRT